MKREDGDRRIEIRIKYTIALVNKRNDRQADRIKHGRLDRNEQNTGG